MKKGYIYIISNPSHKGWVKFGKTNDIKSRLNTYQTGDPQRQYKVEFYIEHPNPDKAEKDIRERIKPFAKNIKNEWVEIDLSMAISRLEEELDVLSGSV